MEAGSAERVRPSKRKWDVVGPGFVPPVETDEASRSLAEALAAAQAASTPVSTDEAAALAAGNANFVDPGALGGVAPGVQGSAPVSPFAPPSGLAAAASWPGALERFVRLRGLPFSAGEADIRNFLSGLEVESVRICVAPSGRATGEALLAMATVEMAHGALERDHTYLGHRYIEVYPATAEEFAAVTADVQQQQVLQSSTGTVLRMRGLPFSASLQDIVQFWAGFALLRVGQVPLGADGRPSGEAYVEFVSADEAARALSMKQHSLMGMRYVELYPAAPEEMRGRAGEGRTVQMVHQELMMRGGHGGGANGFPQHGDSVQTPVLRLRGLPYQATAGDIARFFHGYGLVKILPTTAPLHGRPSGEAYVEFTSAVESCRAMNERQHGLLGQRYIELFLAPPQEMVHASQGQSMVNIAPDGSLHSNWAGGAFKGGGRGVGGHWEGNKRPAPTMSWPEGDPGTVLRMRGLPFQATVEDIVSYFAGCGVARVLPIVSLPGGRATGEAYVEFATPEQCQSAIVTHQHRHMGTRYIELFPAVQTDMHAAVGAVEITEVNDEGPAPPPAGGHAQTATSPVLMMRGLPFQSTTDDITNFFSGFALEKIVAVVPEEGLPNKGEAYVQFPTAEDCSRALKERQHNFVGSRYIELFPASLEDLRWNAKRAGEAERWYTERPVRQRGGGTTESPVLRMRGLPYEATMQDIAYFFEGFNLNKILPCTSPCSGRPSGEAYVEFDTPQDAESARGAKHRAMMGSRWIELYAASIEEMSWAAEGKGLVDAKDLMLGSPPTSTPAPSRTPGLPVTTLRRGAPSPRGSL